MKGGQKVVNSRLVPRRRSRQREVILRIVRETDSHPTAEWIYERARRRIPNLSLGTVYRNLSLLVEEAAIQRLMTGDGVVRYDRRLGDHAHFICTETGRVMDVEAPAMDELIELFRHQTGHRVTSCRILFYGKLEGDPGK
jgi:Fur family transcriptional regulator, peroxide stress response regulator